MTVLKQTPFGRNKAYIAIERCTELTPDDAKLIANLAGEQAYSTLSMESPRPKCIVANDQILLVLRAINFNEGDRPDDMVSVRLWFNAKTFIASQYRPVRSLDEAEGRLPHIKSSVQMMLETADAIFDRIEKHIFKLEEAVDDTEANALSAPNKSQRTDIMEFRRKVIALRRYLLPQRETMLTLSRAKSALLPAELEQGLLDRYYRAARICDQLDAVRERLSLIQEEITATISDRINQNMYVLSVISLIFLPLSFITGLFGINVGGMPGVAEGGAPYEPVAFAVVVLACLCVAVFIFLVMKIKKWI